jgi:hypothetical protein
MYCQAVGIGKENGRGVPVWDSCRAPHRAPRPVRQGKKSGPAEGQGRSVRGRVGQWEDGPVQEVLAVQCRAPHRPSRPVRHGGGLV